MPTLQFKGKTFVQNHYLAVKYHQLVPKKELSLTDKVSLHDNLIIHGDNLKALKALLPTYSGKIKCIFIDPPYNTGNEKWMYNDNVNSPMIKEWLGQIVDKDDLTRHDKWLCMMMPRLKLLKELLAPDGIIAETIDDNELFNLGQIMNEVFGESNILACAPWQAEPSGGKEKTGLRGGHEYVIIYCNGDSSNISQEERSTGELNLRDKIGPYRKGRELRKWGGTSLREDRLGQYYPLMTPDGIEVYPIRNDGKEGHWRWGKNNSKILEILKDPDLLHWEKRPYDENISYKGANERWVPYVKIRDKKKSIGWSTWLDTYGFNSDATRELKEIFGSKVFDTPKPTSLVKWIISLHEDEDFIVLDNYAGSGTTAQAVLELNKEDGGNRKFILVEQEDYANTITAERVRRVIKGVKTAKNENLKNGLGGTFSYFELGETIELENLLRGKNLPSFTEFARYLFYTATGEEFSEKVINETSGFIGESKNYEVYLIYQPDIEWLKRNALTLEICQALPKFNGKQRLVFAPCKYVDDHTCLEYRIDFCQLPYEIYRIQK